MKITREDWENAVDRVLDDDDDESETIIKARKELFMGLFDDMVKESNKSIKKDFIVCRSITMLEGKPYVNNYSEQELIRCKDCKHYRGDKMLCPSALRIPNPDWFCADGERRNNGSEGV